MKKLLALVLCAVMVLAMIPAVTLTTSAAGEGDWNVRRSPNDYDDPENYCPAAGFYYDSEGFHTTAADYTNMGPFYAVVSKETYNMKEGFSMKFRIDDFSYKGESGNADEWISIAIGSTSNLTPGNGTNGWGSGVVTLNRGSGNGSTTVESFWSNEMDTEGNGSAFSHQGSQEATLEVDEQGREIYTLDVSWDGSAYDIKVNGLTLSGMSTLSENLNNTVESGDFYVLITIQTGVTGGTAALSILEVNGSVPAGTESKDPEENVKVYGEKIDASTVAANQPALLFDATKTTFSKDPDVQNCKVEAKGDNSYCFTPSTSSTFFNWGIKNKLTYDAADFPVFAMLLRNTTCYGGAMYYMAGDTTSAGGSCLTSWSAYDNDYCEEDEIGDDYYNLVVVDLGAKDEDSGEALYETWTGRINGFRIDLNGMEVDVAFDICYMGVFRSAEEAVAYKNAYLKIDADATTEAPATETEPETTAAPADETTGATVDETTAAPADDTKAAESATEKASESGCSSMIGGASAVVLAAVAAAVALKKKH